MKTFLAILLLLSFGATLSAAVFCGVVSTTRGLVVVERAGSMRGFAVSDTARVELGDTLRTAEEGAADLHVYDGSTIHLESGGDYRIERLGVEKLLDGGVVFIHKFTFPLGSKTQDGRIVPTDSSLGSLGFSGRVFSRDIASSSWSSSNDDTVFVSGLTLRAEDTGAVFAHYRSGPRLRLTGSGLVHLLTDEVSLERGDLLFVHTGRSACTVATSMASIKSRPGSCFRIVEGRQGCALFVFSGNVALARKAQGLSAKARPGPGQGAFLGRSGRVQAPKRFALAKDAALWVPLIVRNLEIASKDAAMEPNLQKVLERLDRWNADVFASKISALPKAPKAPGRKAPKAPVRKKRKKQAPKVPVPEKQVPTAPEQAPKVPVLQEREQVPTAPVTPEELENLFQLPRLGAEEQFQARPK